MRRARLGIRMINLKGGRSYINFGVVVVVII